MSPPAPVLREAASHDGEAVEALMRRNGMLRADEPMSRWADLWRDNPVSRKNPSAAGGWVLEHSRDIVGYLGSVPVEYRYRGRSLLAAAARGFVVDVAFRGQSLRLVAAFFAQKQVDLFLNTTANAPAGSVFQLCKAERVPQPDYDKALFWIVNAREFAASALRKRGAGRAAATLGSAPLGLALTIEGVIRRRRPRRKDASLQITVIEPRAVDEQFDALWQRTVRERPDRLLADRSSETLRWHFQDRANRLSRATVLGAHRSGTLVGYMVLTREDSSEIGLRRSRIADLVAERDDPSLVDELLHAAFHQAKVDGSHVLELVGFPSAIRSRALAARALTRQLPAWQFWYKVNSVELQNAFREPAVWYASPYDGDASL